MDFAAPGFLWLLILTPLVLIFGLSAERYAGRVRRVFACPVTAGRRLRAIGRVLAISLAVPSLVAALAGPGVWTLSPEDPRRALTLALGIDVSKSMLAEDVDGREIIGDSATPASRLNAAAHLADRLFEGLGGEKAGLFFFARSGIEVVAPTRDQGFLRYMLRHTSLADLTESGSDLAVALRTGSDMIASTGTPQAGAIVLISDGEDTENRLPDLMRRAQAMKTGLVPVFTVGVGSSAEALVPIRQPGLSGIRGFYADSRGSYLKTRLEPGVLKEIAAATGGAYKRWGDGPPEQLAGFLLEKISRSAQSTDVGPMERRLLDLSPVFIGFGLLFFLGYLLL